MRWCVGGVSELNREIPVCSQEWCLEGKGALGLCLFSSLGL